MKTFNFRRLRIQSAMTVALAIACVLVTGNCSPVTAQVAIGGDGTVTPGALLDLSQATDAGGLLLPQIESADTATAVLKKPGMLVYNKTDGKIYAYNGSVWSAGGGSGGGGGGGGGEPDPTPSPKTCGGSVMGVSGNLYPIGSYPYAQNDLKNLCWTLTNLREAGQSFTSYQGESEVRGYYYSAGVASNPETDICKQKLGDTWRTPNIDDWGLLMEGFVDLIAAESQNWIGAPNALAGYITSSRTCSSSVTYNAWGSKSVYIVGGNNEYITISSDADYMMDVPKNSSWAYFPCDGWNEAGAHITNLASSRCVRDL
jgi:hypothetical protein